jgi:hypothetical protein
LNFFSFYYRSFLDRGGGGFADRGGRGSGFADRGGHGGEFQLYYLV